MAAVTLTKRTTGRGFPSSYVEGTDDAVLSSIIRTTAGTATAWGDTLVTSVALGGGTRAAAGTGHSLTLNAGTASSGVGGAVGSTAGAGTGANAGGAWASAAGAAGATGTGGAWSAISGAGGATSGASGPMSLDAGAITSGTPGSINIGTTNAEAVGIGRSGKTTTINGNLTVSGTTTAISTTNLTVNDDVILLNADAATADEAGVAFERGSTGDDSILLWNEANTRFELGLFNTVGGTTAPTGTLTTFSNLRLFDISLDGTAITADGALTVTATSAVLSLDGTGIETSATTFAADAGLAITAAGTNTLALNTTTDGAINIGVTASSGKTITIGNGTGATSMALNVGTGGLMLGDNATAHEVTIGSQTGASGVTIHTGTGGIDIAIGTAVATINVGTGGTGAKTVVVGSLASTSTTTLQAGSGGLDVDSDGDSAWTTFDWSITLNEVQTADSGTAGNPFSLTSGTGAAAGATTTGGTGGAINLTAGVGGAASATPQNAGAGSDFTITAGAGGIGAASATSGAGGDLILRGGAVGAAGGGSASADHGRVAFRSGTTSYFLTATGVGPALTTTAQTIIEAINEVDAASGSPDFTESTWTTTGLTVGAPVYPTSTASTTAHADADAVGTSNVIGLVSTVGASGSVITHGVATGVFAAGDSGYANGSPVFLSPTVGRLTFTAPVGSGQTVIELGYLKDSTGLSATTVDGETATVFFNVGPRTTNG